MALQELNNLCKQCRFLCLQPNMEPDTKVLIVLQQDAEFVRDKWGTEGYDVFYAETSLKIYHDYKVIFDGHIAFCSQIETIRQATKEEMMTLLSTAVTYAKINKQQKFKEFALNKINKYGK